MANTIRIKRRDSSGATGAPSTLENAELAFNEADNILYYGWGTGGAGGSATSVLAIGGPGAFMTRTTSQTVTGDKQFSGTIDFSGSVDFNNITLNNVADPVNAQDAATKAYVDASIQGLDIKDAVRVALSSNVSLTDPLDSNGELDGVVIDGGDRILLMGQSDASENGIYDYVVSNNNLVRSYDADSSDKITTGMFVFVSEGDTHANQGFVLQTNAPIILDTTELAFTQFSGAGSLEAGDGLFRTGNTINLGTASSSRIVVNADNIDLATTGVSASTYKSVTVDVYGRVTAGSNPTTLAGYGITDAINVAGSTGVIARNGSGTVNSRTITGTADRITLTNGDGASGNPTIDIASTYVGQATITTLGTIATGTWNADVISLAYGGTGRDLSGDSDGAFYKKSGTQLIVATEGTDYLSANSTINGGTF